MRKSHYILIISFFISPLILNAQETFEPLDVFKLSYVSNPSISPDGEHVVFIKNGYDIMTDRRITDLWIVGFDGEDLRPLSSSSDQEGSPIWSPNGDRLIWTASGGGKTKVMVRYMNNGEQSPLVEFNRSPGNLCFSPDGNWLAFTQFVAEKPMKMGMVEGKPEGAKWASTPTYTEEIVYRRDGRGELKPGHTQIFVMPSNGGAPIQLTSGPFNYGSGLSWDHDSQHLLFSADLRENAHLSDHPRNPELYSISINTGELKQYTNEVGPESNPIISPDGKQLAYSGAKDRMTGYLQREIWLSPNKPMAKPKALTMELDRNLSSLNWDPEGKYIWFSFLDQGDVKVGRVNASGKVEEVVSGLTGSPVGRPYTGGSYSVGPNGKFAITRGDGTHPAELAVGMAGSNEVRQLTNFNKALFLQKKPGAVETFWTKSSFDQRDIQGWIAYPPDFDPAKKYPLLLEIHGGPWSAYGPHFSMEIQQYTARGYVVVYTNPRGSTSYGEEFADLIQNNYPGEDYDDLMSFVDAVIDRGFIDEEKLFVTGGSGGGVLSSWIVGKTDRFAAAVVAKPVINWFSHILTADAPQSWSRYWMPAMPWEDPEHYYKQSPISLVGNVKTPTMLMVGDKDHRTPLSESEQFYRALKLRGIPTGLMRFPDASHGIAGRPSQMLAKVNAVMGWMARYGGPEKLTKEGRRQVIRSIPVAGSMPATGIINFMGLLLSLSRRRCHHCFPSQFIH